MHDKINGMHFISAIDYKYCASFSANQYTVAITRLTLPQFSRSQNQLMD